MNKGLMRILISAAVLFISVNICGCKNWQYDVEKYNIRFKKIRQSESGNIIGYMTENHTVQGFPCEKGWIHFKENGRVRFLQLSKDFMYRGTLLPAHTWYHLPYTDSIEGYICSFPYDCVVQGHLCEGTGGSKGTSTGFYESGRLRSFYPPDDIEIDGVPCEASPFVNVWLHEKSGRLKRCKLSRNYEAHGRIYKKGSLVEFDENGKVK